MPDQDNTEPLRILVFDTNPHRRAVHAHGLAGFGHRCEQAWEFEQAASLLTPGRTDALLGAFGPGQPSIAAYGRLFERFGAVRETALVALAARFVHGQAETLRRAGFDVALHEPVGLPVIEETLRVTAQPLRPLPQLDHARRAAIRAAQGEPALEALEEAALAAAQALVAAVQADAAAIPAAALALAEACEAAGTPAAALAARRLAAEPERPYLQRALASAMGGARTAARAERMRRDAGGSP